MNPYLYLTGYRVLSCEECRAADIMNVCMKYGFPYRGLETRGGRVFFTFSLHMSLRVLEHCKGLFDVEISEPCGLPVRIRDFFRRPGLVVGLFAAFLIAFFAGRFVWDVRVSGNELMTADEVKDVLSSCGFGRGSSIPDFNADYTEMRALLACDELAWVSVNLRGTVAYVEVLEKIPIDKSEKPTKPANVIAARDGKIVEFIAFRGQMCVNVGEPVRKGDLLISGVYGERAPGVRVTRAAGRVLARTEREFRIEIPLEYEEKVYSERVFKDNFLIFFSNRIKVFSNSGNLGASCDKIIEGKNLSLFGSELPVGFVSEKYLEYGFVTLTRTEAEAAALAKEALEKRLSDELRDARLISRSESGTVADGNYVLTYAVTCVEDIAQTREFEFRYTTD